MRCSCTFILLLCASLLVASPRVGSGDIFGTRCFVENRGQFPPLPDGSRVLYALENGLEQYYFTEHGVTVKMTEDRPLTERELERAEEGRRNAVRPLKTAFAGMHWIGARADISIEPLDQQAHYITYGDASLNSRTYHRLVYHNVYDGIDFEYLIPADHATGIKYNVIVHPNADPSQVRMEYSGDVNSIAKTIDGDVTIKTPAGSFIEHAPKSFQQQKVASAFNLRQRQLSFDFPNGYDPSQLLTIDPWISAANGLTSNNMAYDVDYDYNGYTYIYGGYNPFKVSQYNTGGSLVWTFAGTIASPAWSSAPITGQASNFAVNKFNGKTYIGQGFVYSGNRVIRLDNAGNYDNFINTPTPDFEEVWDMGFHCTNGEVFVLGGGTYTNNSAVTLNDTTAALTISTFQPTNTNVSQDVVSHAVDESGNIFVIYAGGSLTNKITRVNSTFNGNVWTQPSTFTAFTEQGNKTQYQWSGSLSSNGFNCLAVNGNYLFYYDGLNLASYDKTTGALVASTTIAGQTMKRQGGIAVDDCNNLYLGGEGNILCYNFSGTTFSAQTSISLGAASNTVAVYDIKLDKQSKILYAGGNGFVGVYSPLNTLTCPTATSACFFAQQQDYRICYGSTVTFTVPNGSGLSNASYSLLPGPVTSSTGVFVLTPSATATYTSFITGTNAGNVVVTQSAAINVTVYPQPSFAPTFTQSTCTSTFNAFNLGLNFAPSGTPSYSISWSPVPNGVTGNAQTTGTGGIAPGAYTASLLTANGCTAQATFTIDPQPAPATFSFLPPGDHFVIDCRNPVFTLSMTPATFNYTVTNGSLAAQNGPVAVFTNTNAIGTYTSYAVNPVSGCTSSQTFVVTQNTSTPLSSITPSFQNITCSVAAINGVTATASPTINVTHLWMSPLGGSLSLAGSPSVYFPGSPGTFTHCLVNDANGCSTCQQFTIASSDGFPTYSVTSVQNFTLGCSSRSFAVISIDNANTTPPGGSISYTLLGPPTGTNYVPGGISVYTVTVPGTWTVIARDNSNFCETKVPLSVIENTFAPDVIVATPDILTCNTPSIVLSGATSVTNTGFEWRFAGTPNSLQSSSLVVNSQTASPSNTLVGTYTLNITDLNNLCVGSTVVPVYQNVFPPHALITGGTRITCVVSELLLSNQSTSAIPPQFNPSDKVIGYEWFGPTPQLPLQLSSSYNAYMPGTYTMVAKDLNNGCTAIATKTIADDREYPFISKPAAQPFVLDCGASSRTITADMQLTGTSYSYSWTTAPGATVSGTDKAVLTTNLPGQYWILVTNTDNGCANGGFVDVVSGDLTAGFHPNTTQGNAPLTVTFENTSASSIDNKNIVTTWNFGNGQSTVATSASVSPTTVYNLPGTYSVIAYAAKGSCLDSAMHVINVEIPSRLVVPDIFTPNGDGVNDVFFLKTSNIRYISMQVFDRWGHKVFDTSGEMANILWDGKTPGGQDASEGVYFYMLKATGRDGTAYDMKGNITIAR